MPNALATLYDGEKKFFLNTFGEEKLYNGRKIKLCHQIWETFMPGKFDIVLRLSQQLAYI